MFFRDTIYPLVAIYFFRRFPVDSLESLRDTKFYFALPPFVHSGYTRIDEQGSARLLIRSSNLSSFGPPKRASNGLA